MCKFQIKAIVNTLFRNPTIELPITIGTEPFGNANTSLIDSGRDIGFVVDNQPTTKTTTVANASPIVAYRFPLPIDTSYAIDGGFSNTALTQQYDNNGATAAGTY